MNRSVHGLACWGRAVCLVAGCALALPASAGRYEDGVYMPDGECVSGCEAEPVGGGYTGPTAEDLERERAEREAQDLREAAEDASDRGYRAWQSGDLDTALRYYREAYRYAPDDPDILANLEALQRKQAERTAAEAARRNQALEQLRSVESHSTTAGEQVDSLEARKGLDTAGKAVPPSPSSPVPAGTGAASRDPVVPPEKRTPKITALEKQRTEARAQAKVLEEKLKAIDVKKDPVAAAKVKQEITNVENKVNYLNFSIGDALDKPASTKKPKADSPTRGDKP